MKKNESRNILSMLSTPFFLSKPLPSLPLQTHKQSFRFSTAKQPLQIILTRNTLFPILTRQLILRSLWAT